MSVEPPRCRVLREHGVHAATDVTGFGLIGHLLEMVRASNVDVTLAIERMLLAGARETLKWASSPRCSRKAFGCGERSGSRAGGKRRSSILFDPQTAGGLLYAVRSLVPGLRRCACCSGICQRAIAASSEIAAPAWSRLRSTSIDRRANRRQPLPDRVERLTAGPSLRKAAV
jgi:selenide,water dikinase